MPSHYADLKAIPQAEMLQSQVVAHIVQALHGLLPRFSGRIGIGFPAYGQNRTLGGIVRLFGSETDLDDLHCLLQNTTPASSAASPNTAATSGAPKNAWRRKASRPKKSGGGWPPKPPNAAPAPCRISF